MKPPANKLARVAIALVIAVMATVLAHIVQTPFVLRAPGRAGEVGPMVTIRDATVYPVQGQFYLTTVIYDRASLLYCIYATLDDHAELLPVAAGSSSERADSLEMFQMKRSQFAAKFAALEHLGYELAPSPNGARILRVLPQSPALGVLQAGDIVVEAGGHRVRTVQDLMTAVSGFGAGHRITVAYLRNGEKAETEVSTYRHGDRPVIGVQIRTEFGMPVLPVEIDINAGNVSGASAGLVFALEIINRMTPEDLTGGRRIAVTGTLDGWGRVGAVSGADLKVVAAERAGATVFLCPRDNLAEVEEAGTGLRIIPVDTLSEAVQALGALEP